MKLLSGNSNRKLSEDVAKYLGMTLADCFVSRFADHEIAVEIRENMRGEDCLLYTSPSPRD